MSTVAARLKRRGAARHCRSVLGNTMTDPDAVEHTDDTAAAPEGAERAARPRHLSRATKKVLIIGAATLVILTGAGALVFALMQPSQIERAGEACSGTKPLQAIFDEIEASETPDPEADADSEAADENSIEEFAEYFEGVVVVEDDGSTLIVNTLPEDEDILSVSGIALNCVFEELDVPKHITERVGATRSLDGRQDGNWDGFSASWSYHPDSGANVIIVAE